MFWKGRLKAEKGWLNVIRANRAIKHFSKRIPWLKQTFYMNKFYTDFWDFFLAIVGERQA